MSDRRAALMELLDERRRRVEARLERIDADEAGVLSDRSAGTADDEHDPEGSTLSGEWQMLDGLRRAAREERDEIDSAAARLEAGVYGVCESCGRDIPLARLEVRPTATRCVACAR